MSQQDHMHLRLLTVVFDSMCVFSARVRSNPMSLHSDKGIQGFAAPGDGQVGPTDHLWIDTHTQRNALWMDVIDIGDKQWIQKRRENRGAGKRRQKRRGEERAVITLVWREQGLSAVLSHWAFPSLALIKDKPACTYHDMPRLALMELYSVRPEITVPFLSWSHARKTPCIILIHSYNGLYLWMYRYCSSLESSFHKDLPLRNRLLLIVFSFMLNRFMKAQGEILFSWAGE